MKAIKIIIISLLIAASFILTLLLFWINFFLVVICWDNIKFWGIEVCSNSNYISAVLIFLVVVSIILSFFIAKSLRKSKTPKSQS